MERLKERYGDDKEKLNKEIMELYKRNGVNPLGGCLPMVLQFPVFIGLYNALSTPIELRHASFLWIKDLSRPDWQSLPFAVPLVAFCLAFRHSSADNSHGRQHVFATMDDADRGDPKSAQDDDADAVDVYVHVRVFSGRINCLLAGRTMFSPSVSSIGSTATCEISRFAEV